jgi:hypothetical protein
MKKEHELEEESDGTKKNNRSSGVCASDTSGSFSIFHAPILQGTIVWTDFSTGKHRQGHIR